MPIEARGARPAAALDGSLDDATDGKEENFGFDVAVTGKGVDAALLDPRSTWADGNAYDAQAEKLVEMFAENFQQYLPFIDEDVKAAAIG